MEVEIEKNTRIVKQNDGSAELIPIFLVSINMYIIYSYVNIYYTYIILPYYFTCIVA